MSQASSPIELPGLRVSVDEVVYTQHPAAPTDRPHCFIYYITIHNDSTRVVTFRRRKWVIREESKDLTVLEGDGIVGQTPTIIPGENFSYNSFHLMGVRFATAEGAYLGEDEEGNAIVVKIPKFQMRVPDDAPETPNKMWA